MTDYRVTLWIDGKAMEYHRFSMQYGDKGWYTSGISIDYFQKRESIKLWNSHQKGKRDVQGKRCHVLWGFDLTQDELFDIKFQRTLPTFEHNTIWDLYLAVGYDYKKQKYIA